MACEANNLDNALHSTTLVMWAALCANRVQKDYMETKFRHHPSLAPIVNLHLFKHRVAPHEFKALSEKVTTLKTLAKAVKKKTGTLTNKVAGLTKK